MSKVFGSSLIALAFLAANAQAQSSVAMKCQGDISKSMDGRQIETVPASVSLNIAPTTGLVEINGWWGCLADLGQPSSGKTNCSGKLQMSVKDSEFVYLSESDGPMYRGRVFLTINRINGTLKVVSDATSKPPANAQWKSMMYQSDMQCALTQKLF